ncbi:peroxiredoxin-like family protein [Opitutales bacterium ASA1]|uniref:peroxiredoxin family protein n=1 Tax=Congregicoccus parvus TaxID=3081749 RepID=UPI002B2D1013|nr:peroxiredoxin-like family protein [Opitutales bacterium ASA1]
MKIVSTLVMLAATAALLPFGVAADTVKPAAEVGARAPAFTLADSRGAKVSLADLTASGKVALVFFRSADWCPFCIAQLKELQESLPAFEAAGIEVVGISYDSVDTLAKSAAKHGLTLALLSDEGSKTIDAFGIRNHEAKGKGVGVPHPAVFLVDSKGTITAKLMHEGHRTRPTPGDILAAAHGMK